MEVWKDIKGYEGVYQVSNIGRVKRLFKKHENILTGKIRKDGYCEYLLKYNNKPKYFLAHRLVAEAFLPNPDNLPCVNHIDCDKSNNFVKNLEWCTYQENMTHAVDNHLCSKGEKHYKTKLREEQVIEIYNSDLSVRKLASIYGVNDGTISYIKNGKSWRWLTQDE